MTAKDKTDIFLFFREKVHHKVYIAGSTALEFFGIIPPGTADPLDLDLIVLVEDDQPEHVRKEVERKLKLLWGHVETNEDKAKRYGDADGAGDRFFYKYVDYDNRIIKVDVFLTNKLFHPAVFTTTHHGVMVDTVSPENVFIAKRKFKRPKDISMLNSIARSLMV